MHLETSIRIERPPERVWSFLSEVSNIPKWDRGVAAVSHSAPVVTGVGSEFDTVADVDAPCDAQRNGRMSYRIADVDPERHQCKVELTSRRQRAILSCRWSKDGAGLIGQEPLSIWIIKRSHVAEMAAIVDEYSQTLRARGKTKEAAALHDQANRAHHRRPRYQNPFSA